MSEMKKLEELRKAQIRPEVVVELRQRMLEGFPPRQPQPPPKSEPLEQRQHGKLQMFLEAFAARGLRYLAYAVIVFAVILALAGAVEVYDPSTGKNYDGFHRQTMVGSFVNPMFGPVTSLPWEILEIIILLLTVCIVKLLLGLSRRFERFQEIQGVNRNPANLP